jgi:DNA polymerase III epsilon subunit-like protein
MAWTEQPIHFVDFEGGLTSGILEYGVVTLQGGRVTAARTRLCRPTGGIRFKDAAVHGLHAEELAGHAPFADDFELFAQLRETGPLAAHFAGAENSLIKSVWPYARQAPDFARPGQHALEWGPWIDTGAIYRQIYPQLTSLRLADAVTDCNLQPELDALAAVHCSAERRQYHAALYDALGGALLLASLAREPQLAGLSLMQLLALSTLDGGKRDALQQDSLF